ncbi:SDR family oxidoreductase [Anaerolineales bacterium HSG6]|nr:SDR family oxidoreductase [Anaerolineales bacterium HSG6]
MQNKVILITGGAHRVGKAITLAFADAGAHVIINYHRSAEAAEQTAQEARAYGVQALPLQADVSDPQQVAHMIELALERFDRIDVLVNGSSQFTKTPFPVEQFSDWERVMAIIINGAVYCSNAVAPLMQVQQSGAIINIIDLSVWQPWKNFTAHAIGKSGLLALTRQLALELAPTIRVNAVAPGPVLAPPHYTTEQKERIAQRTLLQRWGQAEDVASAVLFLAQASYITGETIAVDGGERLVRKA